jgi:hypothetical protein
MRRWWTASGGRPQHDPRLPRPVSPALHRDGRRDGLRLVVGNGLALAGVAAVMPYPDPQIVWHMVPLPQGPTCIVLALLAVLVVTLVMSGEG